MTSSDDYIYWQLVSWSQYQVLPLTTTVNIHCPTTLSFLSHLKLGMKESFCGHWRLTLIGFDMKMLRIVLLMQPHVAVQCSAEQFVMRQGQEMCCVVVDLTIIETLWDQSPLIWSLPWSDYSVGADTNNVGGEHCQVCDTGWQHGTTATVITIFALIKHHNW